MSEVGGVDECGSSAIDVKLEFGRGSCILVRVSLPVSAVFKRLRRASFTQTSAQSVCCGNGRRDLMNQKPLSASDYLC